jgi:hypothetical protein
MKNFAGITNSLFITYNEQFLANFVIERVHHVFFSGPKASDCNLKYSKKGPSQLGS